MIFIKGLTAKQQLFAKEYLIDLNATQAAIRAGYNPNSANEQASRLLAKSNIRAYIDIQIAERSKRTGVNADRVIRELALIAFADPANVIDFENATILSNATRDDTAAIASVKVRCFQTTNGKGFEHEIRMVDKIRALELLCKHLSMFTNKASLELNTGETGVIILPAVLEDNNINEYCI